MDTRKWIDISMTIKSNMVHWPGDSPVKITKLKDIEDGDDVNISCISMSSHTGTHIDAPLHFINKGKEIDKIPLDILTGTARVITINDSVSIKSTELQKYNLCKGEKILLKTRNSDKEWEFNNFNKDYIYLTETAAKYCVKKGISMIGIDYLSIGSFIGGSETHKILLNAGIWIIEGLKLNGISSGSYEFICLPLKIFKCDGAPARVIIRKKLHK